MFGRRGPSRIPAWLRLMVGAMFFAIGALLLLMELSLFGEPVRETMPIGIGAGVTMGAAGAMLMLGVFTGVGDMGERPRAMRAPTRVALDALGYIAGFGLAALFASIGMAADWSGAGLFPRIGFCGLALLFGGMMAYALVRAIVRAVRGLPYEDGGAPRT